MRAGALDRRIEIQRAEVVQDEYGQPIETWVTVADCAAEVRPLKGIERFTAEQLAAHVDTRFRIRWLPDITPQNRIVFDGRAYDVQAVLELGRRDGLELLARARAE